MEKKNGSFEKKLLDQASVEESRLDTWESSTRARLGLSEQVSPEKNKKKKRERSSEAPSLDELKREKIMSKDDAEKEMRRLVKRDGPGSIGDWNPLMTAVEMAVVPERNLLGCVLVNESGKKVMIDGEEVVRYTADAVFYYKLKDGRVKRMYLSYDDFKKNVEAVAYRLGFDIGSIYVLTIGAMEFSQKKCDAIDAE